MKKIFIITFLTISFFGCKVSAEKSKRLTETSIDLTNPDNFEILKFDEFDGIPDDGILKNYSVTLPEFEHLIYWGSDGNGKTGIIPSNRGHMWVLNNNYEIENMPTIKKGGGVYGNMPTKEGTYSVFKLKNGKFLAVLPLVGEYSMGYFTFQKETTPVLSLASFGTENVKGEVPVLAYATGDNIYEASSRVWTNVIKSNLNGVTAKLRSEKTSPESWDYLGWCSWEEYRYRITDKLLIQAMQNIEESGLPIRWVLIDEGTELYDASKNENRFKLGLYSLKPDPGKWPNGLQPLMKYKKEDGIKWMGLWHHQAGLYKGIDPENNMGEEMNKNFEYQPNGLYTVKGDFDSQYSFYKELFKEPIELGFDFIKVDFQGPQFQMYIGGKNAVSAHLQSNRALEAFARDFNFGLINCFAQDMVCALTSSHSSVTRASQDYRLGIPTAARIQTFQCYNNKLWMGNVVWGDHDMFHSNDTMANRLMAVSKAMAGAPVYVSDAPEEFMPEVITPLCYTDGKLIRPEAPAIPLQESFFSSPLNNKVLYKTIAPLANGAASIVCYNIYDGDEPVTISGSISADDYKHASAMMQPYPGEFEVPEEGLFLFDYYKQEGQKLTGKYKMEITGLNDRLLHLCPIKNGWAIIGRTDKYLSPSTIINPVYSDSEISFSMVEEGEIAIYLKEGTPVADGLSFDKKANGLWTVLIPENQIDKIVIQKK